MFQANVITYCLFCNNEAINTITSLTEIQGEVIEVKLPACLDHIDDLVRFTKEEFPHFAL